MNIIICAAGSSNRLKILTKEKPKSTIKIGKLEIINRLLNCFQYNLITKIIIVTGFKQAILKKKILNRYKKKIIFISNKIYKKTNNMYSLSLAKNEFDSDIIFVNADNLVQKKIIKKFIFHKHKNLVLIDKNKNYFEDPDPVKIKQINGKLLKIDKKLNFKDTNGVAVGLYKLSKKNFDKYIKFSEKIYKSGFETAGFIEPLKNIIKSKSQSIKTFYPGKFKWVDIDNLNDLNKAKKLFK